MPLPTRRPRVATSRNLLVLYRLAPFPRHPLYRRGRRAGSGGPGHPERSDRTRLGTALPRLSSERLPNPFSALPSVMIGAPGLPNCEFFRFLKQTHSLLLIYVCLKRRNPPSQAISWKSVIFRMQFFLTITTTIINACVLQINGASLFLLKLLCVPRFW